MGTVAVSLIWAVLGAVIAVLALKSPSLRVWLRTELPTRQGIFLGRPIWRAVPYPSDVVNLTRTIVPLPEKDAATYAMRWLRSHNLTSSLHPAPNGRHNVLALARDANVSDARVLLFTHLDLVPGGPPLDLSGADGNLIGRGTVDARGIAASMMIAMSRMHDKRVALLLVTGEETDHTGIISASQELPFHPSLTLLNGEPTESKIATAQKGAIKLSVHTMGTACHSGYPELGESAVLLLLDFLAALRAVDWPCVDGRCTTMNIGRIEGGTAANIVPGHASALLSFRVVVDPETVLQSVYEVGRKFGGLDVRSEQSNEPITFYVPPKSAARWGTQYVSYNTDVPYFDRPYRRAVLFGAGSIHVAHTDREFIAVDELQSMPDAYTSIAEELLGSEE